MGAQVDFATSGLMAARDAITREPRHAQATQVVPMYTPLWYATRVLKTTANAWWEGGVPPSRRRGAAVQAVANMAAHFSRRLHAARKPAEVVDEAAAAPSRTASGE